MNNVVKNVDILAIILKILYNHFNSLTKLFSDLYLIKLLDTSAKPFFMIRFYYLDFIILRLINFSSDTANGELNRRHVHFDTR